MENRSEIGESPSGSQRAPSVTSALAPDVGSAVLLTQSGIHFSFRFYMVPCHVPPVPLLVAITTAASAIQ